MDDRTNELRCAITARLERVRWNMSEAEFAKLVDDVARTAERLAGIEARDLGRADTPRGALPVYKEPDTPAR